MENSGANEKTTATELGLDHATSTGLTAIEWGLLLSFLAVALFALGKCTGYIKDEHPLTKTSVVIEQSADIR